MSEDVFLKPRLIGKRFDEHSIPLEFLQDLAVLEQMIKETAKWQFFLTHPERKRIPRGFFDDISLKMSGIDEGSAIPVIVLSFSLLFPPENVCFFEQAREEILISMDMSNGAQTREIALPKHILTYFDRFGRSLRNDEAIEFMRGTNVIKYTPQTRGKLIEASGIEEWTEEASLRGVISELDKTEMTFLFQLRDGTRIKAPVSKEQKETIFDIFSDFNTTKKILLHGTIIKSRFSKIKAIESIETITILDPLDIDSRLDDIRALSVGWLDGKGQIPDSDQLDWFANEFETRYDPDLPLPWLYPTPEGGLQAEWSISTTEVTMGIDLVKKEALLVSVNIQTDETNEIILHLDSPGGWETLNERIAAYISRGAQ